MALDPNQYMREVAHKRLMERLTHLAHLLMWAGTILGLVGLGYILFATLSGSLEQAQSYSAADRERVINNITFFGRLATIGFAALIISICWLYIDEQWLGYLMILLAAAFYWGLPMLILEVRGGQAMQLTDYALKQLRNLAWILMPPGVLLAIYDASTQGFRRLRYGSSLDQAPRLGGNVKSQATSMQRFLGKCWQLPYCRDFIRQRCPIFHARRTCWRDRVGCMCEEKTIMGALVNVRLTDNPRENAKFIPYNKTLTMAEKKERCCNCVIYNEHQRQKYQLLAPVTFGSVVAAAYFYQEQLRNLMLQGLQRVDQLLAQLSLGPTATDPNVLQATFRANETAAILLYVCLTVIALSYLLRLLETAIFHWKI